VAGLKQASTQLQIREVETVASSMPRGYCAAPCLRSNAAIRSEADSSASSLPEFSALAVTDNRMLLHVFETQTIDRQAMWKKY
jgi:hypothetical protein